MESAQQNINEHAITKQFIERTESGELVWEEVVALDNQKAEVNEMEYEGSLSIMAVYCTKETHNVSVVLSSIAIELWRAGRPVVKIKMEMAHLAAALTGRGHVPCTYTTIGEEQT